ncbi:MULTISPECIES: extracellular solute-binding protein [Rhodopseudomonas]|uniref:ABC transporter substrate-binding protein n=1 Tax=Rhodopseudomonas TaxID=1073 RepID=UPI000A630123|nr:MULTISPECIES: extracellular solute-binding protein [Rhodopseudomonas]MDF3811602.1 extracellular solute-binding protein [Rhodopseudomonas sp. BAL398]WOK19922.1 extracellular solute-binding protein [Rhodopseudomonas sp. BAL398]
MINWANRLSAAIVAIAIGTSASAQAADWNEVVKAAKAEGKVTLYSGHVGVPYHPEVAKMFEAKYGIPVEILDLRASDLAERVRTEKATGRVSADVILNGAGALWLLKNQEALAPYGELPALGKLRGDLELDGTRLPIYIQGYGIAVNTKLVPEKDRPKSWKDLLDPKWQGKILSDDMRALGGGSTMFATTYAKFGREFHEKLAAQKPQFSRSVRENARRVARGEFPIYIPFSLPDQLLNKGLPIVGITPIEGDVYAQFDLALTNNAPHPNAARLLMDFFLSDEAQLVYVRSARVPTVKGLDDKIPADVKDIVKAKLLGTSNPATINADLKLATEIYK